VEAVVQNVYFTDKDSKRDLLVHLLANPECQRVLVFARTKHGSDRVARHLERAGKSVAAIHGNKAQNARTRALEGFRSGEVQILVATDIAARGIDVDDISHVINFDLPNIPETYVHRIGRTARAGKGGIAISLCDAEERSFLQDIERLTGKRLTVVAEGSYPRTASPAGSSNGDGFGRRSGGQRGEARPNSGRGNGRGRPQAEASRFGGRGAGSPRSPRPATGQGGSGRPRGERSAASARPR
jgi:ATP-dependent RNA helicase RhlE